MKLVVRTGREACWTRKSNEIEDPCDGVPGSATACDSVDRQALWRCLWSRGVPHKFLNLIKALYANSRGRVKVYGKLSPEFTTSSGVRQGCPLSPFLFNFCLAGMPTEGGTMVVILPICLSLDRNSRDAKVIFEPRTFLSLSWRHNHNYLEHGKGRKSEPIILYLIDRLSVSPTELLYLLHTAARVNENVIPLTPQFLHFHVSPLLPYSVRFKNYLCRSQPVLGLVALFAVHHAQPQFLLSSIIHTLKQPGQLVTSARTLDALCIDVHYLSDTRIHTVREYPEAIVPHCPYVIELAARLLYSSFREMARWLKLLEREFTDRKVRRSNPTSATRLPLSRLGQPDSIPALVKPSGGMAARHRKGVTAERFIYLFIILLPVSAAHLCGRANASLAGEIIVDNRLRTFRLAKLVKESRECEVHRTLFIVSEYAATKCSPESQKDSRLSTAEVHLVGRLGLDTRRTDNRNCLIQMCQSQTLPFATPIPGAAETAWERGAYRRAYHWLLTVGVDHCIPFLLKY
ncbi:hypothetical protein T265_07261 [Opisthorchis viverrini]|uniref:Reverse transcriptase domain-containing protein n=1 Tax=Opisthorchis viverrini TaxID=6198 RepID=A0A075AC15_OPIVI|nr:hypothetical protein T265_07261 [Opisthorchis viverrini]KER25219.1 hypothetical protein T265_07261 [Opisthorchis viverrini]